MTVQFPETPDGNHLEVYWKQVGIIVNGRKFMGALPKKKRTRARIGNRQSSYSLGVPELSRCPQCNGVRRAHRVCGESAARSSSVPNSQEILFVRES